MMYNYDAYKSYNDNKTNISSSCVFLLVLFVPFIQHLIVYAAWTVFFLIAGIVAAVVASRVSNYAASPGAAAVCVFSDHHVYVLQHTKKRRALV